MSSFFLFHHYLIFLILSHYLSSISLFLLLYAIDNLVSNLAYTSAQPFFNLEWLLQSLSPILNALCQAGLKSWMAAAKPFSSLECLLSSRSWIPSAKPVFNLECLLSSRSPNLNAFCQACLSLKCLQPSLSQSWIPSERPVSVLNAFCRACL